MGAAYLARPSSHPPPQALFPTCFDESARVAGFVLSVVAADRSHPVRATMQRTTDHLRPFSLPTDDAITVELAVEVLARVAPAFAGADGQDVREEVAGDGAVMTTNR